MRYPNINPSRYEATATRYGVERACARDLLTEEQITAIEAVGAEREVKRDDLPEEIRDLCFSWGPR